MEVEDDLFSEEFHEIIKQEYEDSNEGLIPESTASAVKVKTEPPDHYEVEPTESHDDKLSIKKEIEIDITDPFKKEIKHEGTSNEIETKEDIQKIDIESQPNNKKKCKIFQCNFCDYTASKTPLLKIHMHIHGYETFACKDCSFTTEIFYRLTKHSKVHTGARRYNCPHCVFKISSKKSFESHMKLHAEEKCQQSLKCTECSFVTDSQLRLKQHTESHTGEIVYNCNWCQYIGDTIRALRFHLTTHGFNKYTCDKCAYTTDRHAVFRRHMAVHARQANRKQIIYKKPIYKCAHCVYEATSKKLLRNHLMLHFCKGSIKTFDCKECSFVTTDPYRLNLHMAIHTGKSPYSCNWCSYTTMKHRDLLTHMNDHSLKEFACKDCEFTTNQYSILKRHLVKKHLLCDHCSYITLNKLHLETHMMIHMKVKTEK